jgi:Restriction endonuclease S subunits
MNADWKEWTVGDLEAKGLLLIQHGNHQPQKEEFTNNGVPFIQAADLAENVVNFESSKKLNEAAYQIIKKGRGQDLDTILSTKGNVVKIAFVPSGSPAFVCSPEASIWRSLDHLFLDPVYLYYELRSRQFVEQISLRIGGSDTAENLSLTSLRELVIRIPELFIQRWIVRVLTFIDRTILLKSKINQTRESAQSIFQSWFVDFDPVKAKIATKERWYAMQPAGESASPVCYAEEAVLPDLETYINLAAMRIISGKSESELAHLQQQNPGQYQQLAEIAALFPSEMEGSELAEAQWSELNTLRDEIRARLPSD